ncbi:MAG: hypothetical protein Fur002_19810 [Anaerolineales bacterium]
MTEEFLPEESANDTMFQDAAMALRKGDKARAKELLTLLLKADQNNPTYWIWLSASMDTNKERVYCLQTALKLDPENGTAKRGLILLGALAADESIQPFSLNRARGWEEKLLLANEKPKEKGLKALAKSPALRLAGIGLVLVGLAAAVMFGFVLPRRVAFIPTKVSTAGPTPTFTGTPTLFGATAAPTEPGARTTPLSMMLAQTYTPTAVYVNTPRSGAARDQYRVAQDAYARKDWGAYIASMEIIAGMEPTAADVPYLIGEAYRIQGKSGNAIKAYNNSLKIDENFAPAYLGLARARFMSEPKADLLFLYDEALDKDPNYAEAYIARAEYLLLKNKFEDALKDLDRANDLMPESPLVYMTYAETYLKLDDKEKALQAAEKAYSLDVANIPVYKMLGSLYIENGDYERAIDALNLYTTYETKDDLAFAMLGRAQFELNNYETAVQVLDRAFSLNRNGLRKYYLYRGLANLELNNIDQAVDDLEKAQQNDEKSFAANFGLMRAYYLQEKFGSAFQRAEAVRTLAETDEQTALAYYWHALIQEQRGLKKEASKDWQTLLAMDESTMTEEMRQTAVTHLLSIVTLTPTPKGAQKTSTPTLKVTPTRTPTP